jgi:release factor glutamine methyltransferase
VNPLTVAQALAEARLKSVDRLDAQLLLAHALGQSRTWLLTHEDTALTSGQASAFGANLARRAEGEPLAYVLGEKEFHGLNLQVNRHVLVPRPDTEILVDWALEVWAAADSGLLKSGVLDLGTGSGAIALAIKHRCPQASVVATDISPAALAVAQANAQRLRLAVEFQQSDWWAGLSRRRFGLVVSNPPYIEPGDEHLHALRHEPAIALVPNGRGTAALAAIVARGAEHLEPGGWLLLEHGYEQGPAVQALLRVQGFLQVETRPDLAGRPRCTGGHT